MQINTSGNAPQGLERTLTFREQFFDDVVTGLSCYHKHLDSKYFYDAAGDALFQQIMQCSEYYPTNCEMDIFMNKRSHIVHAISELLPPEYDVIELGAGDASKSKYLLQEMVNQNVSFTYYPVDISGNILLELEQQLPKSIPGLSMHGLHGDYMNMLKQATALSKKPKVVLFLGGNIGNFEPEAATQFCTELNSQLNPGDLILIGFDLKKHPMIILDAYNDKQGFTRAFNLNLLHRINRELKGNFAINQFEHYPCYDPSTGACKSYLISKVAQEVSINNEVSFLLNKDEPIYMEIAQKYSTSEIHFLASESGFTNMCEFTDSKGWFADHLWQV
ncbi:dimethylhistidine N-methyltransferase [Filimonas lacunae]|uniref:Dimethylhistidine N-methyltransferase n=1 Tax=Filimonas lacunae TaxID=477680 RepID=A0A173MFH3_9BACT|nr:L-histidine N(alpha)-methyltransferase [Filimonas lacunae]BAV06362.1 hypothetical protein FLA_2378 [Filimonas lacunae]SIT26623.1 dimethylhistidine N-methyltransferase [Filimonas lacunae]